MKKKYRCHCLISFNEKRVRVEFFPIAELFRDWEKGISYGFEDWESLVDTSRKEALEVQIRNKIK